MTDRAKVARSASEAERASVLLCCERLEVGYRGAAILPPIDTDVRAGDLWVVIGRNGAGKSTFFRTLLGLLPPIAGRVRRLRADLRVSYVPQRAALDPLFPLAVRDVVAMGLERGRSIFRPRLGARSLVASALEEAGATELEARPFRELSEGQKARVLLARLIASRPDLALLDEPTAAMDLVAERRTFELLDRLRRERGTTIIVVSHFLSVAQHFATKAIFLDRDCGTVVTGDPAEVFGHADFHRSYGVAAQEIEAHARAHAMDHEHAHDEDAHG